jgi:hypothetical protein
MSMFHGMTALYRSKDIGLFLEEDPSRVIVGSWLKRRVIGEYYPGDRWCIGDGLVDDVVRMYGKRPNLGPDERRMVRKFLRAAERKSRKVKRA